MPATLKFIVLTLSCATLAGCAQAERRPAEPPLPDPRSVSAGPASIQPDHPRRKTIERIEAGLAFWGDAEDVGLPGVVSAKGRNWRVKIRDLTCQPDGSGTRCSYETRPCFRPPTDMGIHAWCRRQRRFVRGHNFSGADGWIADLPQDAR